MPPYFEDYWSHGRQQSLHITPENTEFSGYSDFLAALEAEVLAFDKPVVFVHGDTHYFRVDQPLFSTGRKRLIEHFTRVETFGSPNVHWVRVLVDPSDPQVFTFKPEIVPKNLVKHGSPCAAVGGRDADATPQGGTALYAFYRPSCVADGSAPRLWSRLCPGEKMGR